MHAILYLTKVSLFHFQLCDVICWVDFITHLPYLFWWLTSAPAVTATLDLCIIDVDCSYNQGYILNYATDSTIWTNQIQITVFL